MVLEILAVQELIEVTVTWYTPLWFNDAAVKVLFFVLEEKLLGPLHAKAVPVFIAKVKACPSQTGLFEVKKSDGVGLR